MNAKNKLERVLFIAPEMMARGTNEYVTYLAAELQRLDIGVAVFCAPGPMLEFLEAKGIDVTTFDHLAGVRSSSRRRAEFREKLQAFAPDIVHVPGIRALKSYLDVSGDYEAPLVLTTHYAPERSRHFRALASKLSGIIVTSQKVREKLVNDLKLPKGKIAMIPNGIDVEGIGRGIAEPVFSRSVPVMGSVGPVERNRGHELFLEAAAKMMDYGKSAQFVVAGEGGEISKLVSLGSELGLDKRLTFVRDFSSYHEVLEALDVVVQSARVEVSGFSILDAMAAARPVVAFNTGTACEIIDDGKTGLIVPEEDSESLTKVLVNLIESPLMGRKLGEEARRWVCDKFDIRNTASSIVKFYYRILG